MFFKPRWDYIRQAVDKITAEYFKYANDIPQNIGTKWNLCQAIYTSFIAK